MLQKGILYELLASERTMTEVFQRRECAAFRGMSTPLLLVGPSNFPYEDQVSLSTSIFK